MKTELALRTVAGLKDAGIDFVSYIPETRLSEILSLMAADDSFMLAPVSSEAEAVGIALLIRRRSLATVYDLRLALLVWLCVLFVFQLYPHASRAAD